MPPSPDQDRTCLELASALCARLCHDLASPLGTLSGTLELAIDEPEEAAEALAIAGEAAAALVARLELLRAAWAGDCGPMGRARLTELATGLPPRVKPVLDGLADVTFDGGLARVLLNMLLLGADALPAGGTVALAGDAGGGIVLSVDGPSVRWSDDLAAVLRDPAGGHSAKPRTVQMPLTAKLALAAGLRLSFLLAPNEGGHGRKSAPALLLAPL